MKETYPEDENVTQSERHGELKRAVITVGDGRGFVVNGRAYFADSPHDRLIITAAHCLPFFPPCHGASYGEERTYQRQDHGRLDWPARERLMVYRRSSRGNGSRSMHD